ncbi:MAG: glycoside hydrolase family 127 protein, partial [Hafnia sp.]
KVAIQRGPLVYCLEQADNGTELHNLTLPPNSTFTLLEGKGIFAHKTLIQATGTRVISEEPQNQPLYRYDAAPEQQQEQKLTFIPWFSWANRGEGE